MNGKNNRFKRLNRIHILKVFITLSLMFSFFMLPSFSQNIYAIDTFYGRDVTRISIINSQYYNVDNNKSSVIRHALYTVNDDCKNIVFIGRRSDGSSELVFYCISDKYVYGGSNQVSSDWHIYPDSSYNSFGQGVRKYTYNNEIFYVGANRYGASSGFQNLSVLSTTDFDYIYTGPANFNVFLSDEILYKMYHGLPIDGFDFDDVKKEDSEESDFWIENLQSYEKRGSLLSGIQTYVSWDSLSLNEFPDVENLTVEAKINFTTEHKQTHVTNSYTDVPLFEGIPDTDTQYKFTNYDFLGDYCSKNGIDDSMLLYQTDKISCRYKYTKTIDGQTSTYYTPWQGTGETHNGANNPLYNENIDISNLRFIYTHNDATLFPNEEYHYKFMWDNKESYNENAYMVITSDINWKPTIGKLNSVNNVPYIVRGDLLASNCEVEFSVSDAWKKYFAKEGIDYSVFSTQWVENFYFQVFKKVNGEWKNSNKVRFNVPTQSSGQGSVNDYQFETETGQFDESTGEWVPGSYDVNGNFIPEKEGGNPNRHTGNGGTGEITDKDNTNIGDWGLPDDMSVIDYITSLGESLVKNAKSLFVSVGEIPKLVGQLFTWIPFPIVSILCLAILVCILLRILGR